MLFLTSDSEEENLDSQVSSDFGSISPYSLAVSVPLRDCPEGQTRSAVNNECRKPLKPG